MPTYQPLSTTSLEALHGRVTSTQANAVYTSRDQALDDLTRLHKLNDFDGIKLRVLQIYRERTDLEDLARDSCKLAKWYLQEAEKRERGVSEAWEAARRG